MLEHVLVFSPGKQTMDFRLRASIYIVTTILYSSINIMLHFYYNHAYNQARTCYRVLNFNPFLRHILIHLFNSRHICYDLNSKPSTLKLINYHAIHPLRFQEMNFKILKAFCFDCVGKPFNSLTLSSVKVQVFRLRSILQRDRSVTKRHCV